MLKRIINLTVGIIISQQFNFENNMSIFSVQPAYINLTLLINIDC